MAKETREESSARIQKGIDAERARRPNGYATRCELCAFWEVDWPTDPEKQDDEDAEGECKRYAPRTPHRHSVRALGLIAWAVEQLANVRHQDHFDYLFESEESPRHNGALTYAHDWCGEFQARSTQEETP